MAFCPRKDIIMLKDYEKVYYFKNRTPLAPLRIVAMDNCRELVEKADRHIVALRQHYLSDYLDTDPTIRTREYDKESYLIKTSCPRFGSGEAKGVIEESVRGSDLFMQLAARFPEADFHWFGGTKEAVKACREEAESCGVSNAVFHGNVSRSELPLAQAACDVLLMPYANQIAGSGGGNSAEICSPMKMFEYMAEGRCILSSDLPVIHEILDENCAVFCEPENTGSWEKGLRTVLASQELRERLGSEVKKRSVQYTWQKRAEIYLNGSSHV